MKFDSNRAWQEASAAVAASREALFALAGVFFLVPSLAFALFTGEPQLAANAKPQAAMAMMQEYYLQALPWLVPVTLLQGAGSLAVLALLSHHARPTVGEAIRTGFLALLPYIAAQLLLSMGLGLAFAVPVGLGMAGAKAVALLIGMGLAAFAFYAMIKTSLLGPVIVIEGERNPMRALARSWRLTKGNSARILVFYLLIGLAFLIVTGIGAAIVGAIIAVVAGPEAGRISGAVVQSTLGAGMTLYFVAATAAIHRQLAGIGIGQAFD